MSTSLLNDRLIAAAALNGFQASIISTDQLVFVPEYRKYCEDNLCGNYNKNYACPPYCGTPEEMKARTQKFQSALVLVSSHKVKNAMDPVETGALKKKHNRDTMSLIRDIKTQCLNQKTLSIMAGPCSLCAKCHMQEQKPCPMEMDRYSCLSAYCIDVVKLAETIGLELSWSLDQASFFSMILF